MAGVGKREGKARVGARLRLARKELGFTLEDVERMTNIHARDLQALEQEDFEALPSRTWARGFLVTYANRLGIEGKAVADEVFPLRREPRPMRWVKRHWRWLLAGFGALATAAMFLVAAAIVAPYNNFTKNITDALDRIAPGLFLDSGPQRVVLLGFTGTAGGDNILAAKIADDGLGLLSIPGDTVTQIPDHGKGEIADAAALGGPDLARRTVARMTGTEVSYYVVIDAEGVRNVVDTMDGVRVNVPRQISGRASVGGPTITLPPGTRVLDGDEALVYLQGRDLPDGLRRAERQRNFLYTMFRQALAPGNLISDPATLTTVHASTETNVNLPEALQFATRLKALEDSGKSVRSGVVTARDPSDETVRAVLEETMR